MLHKAEPAADVESEAHELWQWAVKSPTTMVEDGACSLIRAVRRVSTQVQNGPISETFDLRGYAFF